MRPGALAAMMVANLALFSFRLIAARDAYQMAGGATRLRTSSSLAAGFGIALALLVPHVVFGYYDAVQYNLATYVAGLDERGKDIPDVELIRHDVQVAITNPSAVAVAELGLEALDETCS